MKISVLGSGAFGIAISICLSSNAHEVWLWSHKKETHDTLLKDRRNDKVLKNIIIPTSIHLTDDITCVEDSDIVIIATPSYAVLEILEEIKPRITSETIVVLLAKGIIKKDDEYLVFSKLAESVLGEKHPIVALTGPTHAEEIAVEKPCAILSASNNEYASTKVQEVFMNSYFRVYTTDDIVGAQLGGAMKNVIAIAAGISNGMGFGDNATAGLITRGFAEIIRLGVCMGAKPQTFIGLSGIGDLIVTCMSQHSRNRKTGEYIGSGLPVVEAMDKVGSVVEGYYATKFVYELSKVYQIEMPITEALYEILYLAQNPYDVFKKLMNRTGKAEGDNIL